MAWRHGCGCLVCHGCQSVLMEGEGPAAALCVITVCSPPAVAYCFSLLSVQVACRAIGIGSYLVRLGQRIIQVETSHIILTGAQALNKVSRCCSPCPFDGYHDYRHVYVDRSDPVLGMANANTLGLLSGVMPGDRCLAR